MKAKKQPKSYCDVTLEKQAQQFIFSNRQWEDGLLSLLTESDVIVNTGLFLSFYILLRSCLKMNRILFSRAPARKIDLHELKRIHNFQLRIARNIQSKIFIVSTGSSSEKRIHEIQKKKDFMIYHILRTGRLLIVHLFFQNFLFHFSSMMI